MATGSVVHFKGKGRKERSVPLWPKTSRTLRIWIEKRGENPDHILFPNAGGGTLSTDGATYILDQGVQRAIPSCPSLKTKRVLTSFDTPRPCTSSNPVST